MNRCLYLLSRHIVAFVTLLFISAIPGQRGYVRRDGHVRRGLRLAHRWQHAYSEPGMGLNPAITIVILPLNMQRIIGFSTSLVFIGRNLPPSIIG